MKPATITYTDDRTLPGGNFGIAGRGPVPDNCPFLGGAG